MLFSSKKTTKREISDQFSGKSPHNRTTIFTKRNGFYARYSVFFNRFLVNKEQNVKFQVDFQAKPIIIEQFFENVMVLYDRYILSFKRFLSKKRTKREISDRFSLKTQYNRTTIFTKRNIFYDRYSVFF